MEKFRVQIEFMKKYHFWILFGLVMVVMVFAVFPMVSADSSSRFDKGKRRITDVETKLNTIKNNIHHPNTEIITEMQALTGKVSKINPGNLSNQVFAAWKSLYNVMRQQNHLPDIFNAKKGDPGDIVLQKEFENQFDKVWRPMEDIPTLPKELEFSENDRDKYQYHIKGYFPTLLDLIEWRHIDTSQTPGEENRPAPGRGRPMAALGPDDSKKMVGIVDWDDAEKSMGRFQQWSGSPTTLQIMIAQEDLWVYESMLKVIRNTNNMGNTFDEKTAPYISPGSHKSARVKRILALEIGQDALVNWQKADQSVIRLATDSTAAAAPGAAPGGAPGGKLDMRGGSSFGAGNTGTSGGIALLANRYVDENGKPLEDSTKQPFAEFRMMPIFMRVVIEQSAISRLLAACGNSSMRIDVTALRLLASQPPPYEPAAADAAGATPGAPGSGPGPGGRPTGAVESPPMGGGMHRGGMIGGGHGGGMLSGPGSGTSADEDDAVNTTFPTVILEIHGIVYIYNKPKFSQLGKGSATGGSAETPPPGSPDSGETEPDSSTVVPDASGAATKPADSSKPAAGAPGAATEPNAAPPAASAKPADGNSLAPATGTASSTSAVPAPASPANIPPANNVPGNTSPASSAPAPGNSNPPTPAATGPAATGPAVEKGK